MIIEYIGLGSNRQPRYLTRVKYRCDACKLVYETTHECITRMDYSGKHYCRACSKLTVPITTPEDFILNNDNVVDVIGPLTTKGLLKYDTTIICKCRFCERPFKMMYPRYVNGEDVKCQPCYSERTPDKVINEYDFIIGVEDLGERGVVINHTTVYLRCSGCGDIRTRAFGNAENLDDYFCRHCQLVLNTDPDFPADIEDQARVDEGTLGRLNHLVNTTRLYFSCENCGEEVPSLWGEYKKRQTKLCRSCEGKQRWKNGAYGNRSGLNSRSKEHKRFKKVLLENGIAGFESEQWIGQKRVDELDPERKLIILYHGKFWHADKRFYQASRMMYSGMTAKDVWKRDKEYREDLERQGYSVYEAWSYDFKNHQEWLLNDIRNWINRSTT